MPWSCHLTLPLALALLAASSTHAADPRLRIGSNFTGSTFNVHSSDVPPDTDGAVGPRHIVELINGHYATYHKASGRRVQASSLEQFWIDAGASVRGRVVDPRVLFDPHSDRWFASTPSFNGGNGPDDLLMAVSRTSDPTRGWVGVAVPFSGPVGDFVDFPTLGIDGERVYLFANGAVLVVPKADLVSPTPSFANARFVQSHELLTPISSNIQPVVNLDNTGGAYPMLGPWDVEGTSFRRWSIGGPVAAPALDPSVTFIPVTPYPGLGNQGALQPESGVGVATSSQKFASSLVQRNGVIWGVQGVGHQGRAVLRWFAIDAATNALLQEGLVADPARDVFMGSIAVNACNDVVIGFNKSGVDEYVSAYAVAGRTSSNVTTFGEPILLKSGVAKYEVTGGAAVARWGDYSATVVDPQHPLTFWTFQEWPSARDVWSTQITELRLHKAGRGEPAAGADGCDAR